MSNTYLIKTEDKLALEKKYYLASDSCYDLYPSLSRKVRNDCVQVAFLPSKKDLTAKDTIYSSRLDDTKNTTSKAQSDEKISQWDLYPGLLRSAENSGSDRLRQRLHGMRSTIIHF
ncbi:hypothetical protein BY458DRAFT_503061 [Sporodiniella umbellata]|nr:hypothetical protein BY458DRAFT_503061 [Sporodiniella umbellata]